MRIAMAQINSTLGDLEGNARKIGEYIEEAKSHKADLIALPELAITGYPPQDLLYENTFIRKNKKILEKIVSQLTDIVGIVGYIDSDDHGDLYNAAGIFENAKLVGKVYKTLLPTYDVFDEDRYFKPGKESDIRPFSVGTKGQIFRIGVEICEDLWDREYEVKPTDLLAQGGADIIVNISASPFYAGKRFERETLLREKAVKNRAPIFYTNLVGGQDDLVFDGQSSAFDASGNLIAFGKQFEEDMIFVDISSNREIQKSIEPSLYDREAEIYGAISLGIRDYFKKCGFRKAVVGMSGGIDSSVTACIGVEALGKDNVIGVSMPSQVSSEHSKTDAAKLAENLGICFIQLSIKRIFERYRKILETPLDDIRQFFHVNGDEDDPVAYENLQPRIRGNILMFISNILKELEILVLNTGNKTELALGYCTLYGDMVGGIGALGDVSKREVYKIAEYINRRAGKEMIPERVLKKKPSPELKEGQFTPFDFSIVSPMVDEIIENRRGKIELIQMGYPKDMVDDVYRRMRRAEYKRRQASPSIKITQKAFGIGWKMPIVNKFSG